MFWSISIILFMLFLEVELINHSLSLSPLSSSSSLSLFSSTSASLLITHTYHSAQPSQHFPPINSINLVHTELKNLWQFENDQNGLTANEIVKFQQIANGRDQNLRSMTTYNRRLQEYNNRNEAEKSTTDLQMTSNIDNQLWPAHKHIPEIVKEGGQWYYDRNDLDYSIDYQKVDSAYALSDSESNKLLKHSNDTILHGSQIANVLSSHSSTVKLGFGITLSAFFLLFLILIFAIHRKLLRRNSQSKNDTDHSSYRCDFCIDCGFDRKTIIKKMVGISFGRLRHHNKNKMDRCHESIQDLQNLWLLERSRLVVFHEMKLGSGKFCNIYKGALEGLAPICKVNPSLATSCTFKDCMCAAKILSSTADDIAHADFMQEIKFMKSLKYHPYVISMLGVSIDDNDNIMLLIEYCDLGDLLHLVRNKKNEILMNEINEQSKLRIKDLVLFAWQISNGLEYLSSIGCVHRDIAARNILVNAANVCKIADFSLCRTFDSFIYIDRSRNLPLKWMAPESLRSLEYSSKTDVWSYGVLLYEIFSFGEVPYALMQSTEILDFLNSGARLNQPQYCPINVYTLMLQCWQNEPSLRPNFTEICAIVRVILEDSFGYYGCMNAINPDDSLDE